MTSNSKPEQYRGCLRANDAAAAMQAARLNALDLLDTSEILFELKRFGHALAFATLSIEEAAKVPILFSLLLGAAGEEARWWNAYRRHRPKTAGLNSAIVARIKAEFPELPAEEAEGLGVVGPSPDDLEFSKQAAIYSDCFTSPEGLICHLPRNVDRRHEARARIAEARALVHSLRDRTPEELSVWLRHVAEARAAGQGIQSIIRAVHAELVERGFIKDEWWRPILKELERAERGV